MAVATKSSTIHIAIPVGSTLVPIGNRSPYGKATGLHGAAALTRWLPVGDGDPYAGLIGTYRE